MSVPKNETTRLEETQPGQSNKRAEEEFYRA
jgi:hypothetical protein